MASLPGVGRLPDLPPLSPALTRALNFAIESDPLIHEACKGIAGRVIRLRLESVSDKFVDWRFAADGLLEAVSLPQPAGEGSVVNEPDLILTLQPAALKSVMSADSHRVSGIRIEGDAALAERLAPLVAVLKEKVSLWRLALANHPIALAATEAVLGAAKSGRFLLSREQADETSQRLRRLRESLDRADRRLRQLGG